MAFGSGKESIEIDVIVNGKQAKMSLKEIEAAQEKVAKTSDETTKNIKMNWKGIGIAAAAAAAAMGLLVTKALALDKTLFGLNEQSKAWVKNASSFYGVDQKLIAGFAQTGRAAGMSGDEIAKMIDQAVALGRAYPHESTEGFIDNLTMLNRTGEAQGYIVDILEQKYGTMDLKLLSTAQKMAAVEEATKGVNEEYNKTDSAKAEKSLNDLDIAATELGTQLMELAGAAGVFTFVSDGLDWIAQKAEEATAAFKGLSKEVAAVDSVAGAGGGGSWGPEQPTKPTATPTDPGGLGIVGKAKVLEPFAPNITKEWIDQNVAANEAIANENKRAADKAAREAARVARERARASKSAYDTEQADLEAANEETLRINEQFWTDYAMATMTGFEFENAALTAQYEEYKKHVTDKVALEEWYNEEKTRLLQEQDLQMQAYTDMAQSLTDGLTQGIIDFTETGKASFEDMAKSIIQNMIQIQIQSSMMQLMGGFSNDGGGALGALFGGLFADGAAFSNGRVTPFANGGVVSSPTMFPMADGAGLMGEAGPEAIVPLSRGKDGALGIKMEGGGTNVNVNVINNGDNSVDVKQDGNNIDIIVSKIATDIQRGTGPMGTALESRYSLRKQ